MEHHKKGSLTSADQLMEALEPLRHVPDWLRAPLQGDRVLDGLRNALAEVETGAVSLKSCGAKRLFLEDTSGIWHGTYRLGIRDETTRQERELLLHGQVTAPWLKRFPGDGRLPVSLGSPGWSCFLPELNLFFTMEEPEAELTSLPQFVDPTQARALLEQVLRTNEIIPPGIAIASCAVKILSYKPGSRCTIRYELQYTAEGCPSCPRAVIGKVYRKASKAQNAFEGMLALWRSPLSRSSEVTIARPLAYLAEPKAMFQEAIPGEKSLEDLLLAALDQPEPDQVAELEKNLDKTAAGLAAFHHSGALYGKTVGVADKFSVLHELVQRLSVPFASLAENVEPLLAFLERYDADHPPDPLVPTHGTINPEQFLLFGEQIGLIDFDDYCIAEPAMDVGLFRGAIMDTGLNALEPPTAAEETVRGPRYAFLDRIGNRFQAEYEKRHPVSRGRVALWETLDSLRNLLHTWIKVKPAEPDHALYTLEQQVRGMGSNLS